MAAALTISGRGFNPFWSRLGRLRAGAPFGVQCSRKPLPQPSCGVLEMPWLKRIETRGRRGVDARRVALTAAFGGALIGPAGHGWYLMLDQLVLRMGLACSTKSVLLKVAVDNLLYSPCYVLAFFAYGCLAIDGISPAAFMDKMQRELLPTMLAEALVWPPYMAAVFSRVPVQHQLLAVNVATLFDVCFLSWARNRHPDCEKQDQPQQNQMLQGGVATQQAAEKKGDSKAVSGAARRKQLQEEFQQQQQLPPPRTAGEARRRELASCLWDTAPEPSLGRMALMAASTTCSTGGGMMARCSSSGGAAACASH